MQGERSRGATYGFGCSKAYRAAELQEELQARREGSEYD